MKKLFITILIALSSLGAMAQDGLFAVTYSMAMPLGSTSDYISKFSPRGFGVEGRGFLNDNISLGGSFTWNVFFEELKNETFTQGTESITANQFRYINTYPINFTAHYYFGDYGSTRFNVGLGLGAYKINRRTEFGIFQVEHNYWHFGLAPEAGVLIPLGASTDIMLSVRYNYAFKTEGVDYSWLGFNVGFAWY